MYKRGGYRHGAKQKKFYKNIVKRSYQKTKFFIKKHNYFKSYGL